jgi:exonuclease SbcC
MIKSIHLENYMAHEDTSIELSPGVTVITGPNNVGKSAVVEAIRYVVQNPPPKHVIRHGAKHAVVRLELDSGEIVEWHRSDKTAFYKIIKRDGDDPQGDRQEEAYRKLGREVPQDIRALLRLDQVKTEGDDIDLHIGDQRRPIFLLDKAGSQAAAFFAASTEADYLIRMQQALKRRTDTAKASRKELSKTCDQTRAALLRYAPLDSLEADLRLAEQSYQRIKDITQSLPLLREFIQTLTAAAAQYRLNQEVAVFLQDLRPPAVTLEVDKLHNLVIDLQDQEAQLHTAAACSQVYNRLGDPPVLLETQALDAWLARTRATGQRLDFNRGQEKLFATLTLAPALSAISLLEEKISSLRKSRHYLSIARQTALVLNAVSPPAELQDLTRFQKLITSLNRAEGNYWASRQEEKLLAPLQSPPELHNLENLQERLNFLAAEQTALERITLSGAAFSPLQPVPDLEQVTNLESTRTALAALEAELTDQNRFWGNIDARLEKKKGDIEKLIVETGYCPLCGSPMDISHFLDNRHDDQVTRPKKPASLGEESQE